MVCRLFQPAARYKRFVDLSLVNAYRRRKLESARFVVSRRVAANGVAVALGIIRQVYRIGDWSKHDLRKTTERSPTRKHDETKNMPKQHCRWRVSGEFAMEMQHYIGMSVARHRKRSAPEPNLVRQLLTGVCSKKMALKFASMGGIDLSVAFRLENAMWTASLLRKQFFYYLSVGHTAEGILTCVAY